MKTTTILNGKNPEIGNVGDVLELSGWSKTKEVLNQFGDEELMRGYEDVYLYGLFDENELYDLDDDDF